MTTDSIEIFGRHTRVAKSRDFEALVCELAENPQQSAFFCNVHMLMLSQEDPALARAMDNVDWVFADGAPVAWLQRRISGHDAQVIRGYEILLAVCKYAVERGQKIGFLGSTSSVLNHLVENLTTRFAGLDVAYCSAPPFMQGDLISPREELAAIRESGIDWLFVGLGCPKQEKWIARYGEELDCHVLGVGAAFDWLAGTTRKPPGWMEKAGLAWLFRLLQDPKNMWHRYLIYNSKFVVRALKTK